MNEYHLSLCESLDISMRTTAANSRWFNTVCERQDGLIAVSVDKILEGMKCSKTLGLA